MSAVSTIVKNTFGKVFNNLAKEMNVPVENLQLGIYYVAGLQKYEVYNQFKREKEIDDFGSYCGTIIDWSGGSAIIESQITTAGIMFSKELKCNIDSIKIIMAYKKDSLPNTVLLQDMKKVRSINIEKELLT